MKFIHCADVHLDSVLFGIKAAQSKSNFSVITNIQNAFTRMIDFALSEKVDFILIAGDLFDREWKDYQQGLFFIEQVSRLKCPVYYVGGNHDAACRLIKTLPFPQNVHQFSTQNPETHFLEDLKVAIHGMSYETYQQKQDLSLLLPKPIEGYFNIGLLHSSGPRVANDTPYSPFDLDYLVSKGYDYWALGHIHASTIINEKPYVVYPGVLQGRNIKEEGAKGFYCVSIDKEFSVKLEFKEVSVLQFQHLEVDITEVRSENCLKDLFLAAIEREALNSNSVQWVLRVYLKGETQIEHLNTNEHYESVLQAALIENGLSRDCFIESVKNLSKVNVEYIKNSKALELSHLIDGLGKTVDTDSLKENFDTELALVLKKSPYEYLKHFSSQPFEELRQEDLSKMAIREIEEVFWEN